MLKEKIESTKPDLGSNIQHASCTHVAPIGTYPTKALCGVTITGPCSIGAQRCKVCLDLIGTSPCGACGRNVTHTNQ